MAETTLPRIAITMGDPCGIGPEVIAKMMATGEPCRVCRPIVIGNTWAMEQAVKLVKAELRVREVTSTEQAGCDPRAIDVMDMHNLEPSAITVGKVSAAAGKACMEWVTKAARLCLDGQVDAMCTAPVNKEAAALGGVKAVGHTELLAEICHTPIVVTMLMTGKLRCAHLSTHKSVLNAVKFIKKENILPRLEIIARDFAKWGKPDARIAAAAINPHGSDNGLLGDEELKEIGPAVQEARAKGINVVGPVPADSVFVQAMNGQYDVVLAMFHDQGHIPIKVHNMEKSVSVNLGLPLIRTSVDHGTAFDIAGKGIANPVSMLEALKASAALAAGKGLQ